MLAVEGFARHKNVTLGARGVGLVFLLQDKYCVPRVAVRKVNPEVGPIRENGPNRMFVQILSQQLYLDTDFFKKIDITMSENCQGINPMVLSDPWVDYKFLFTNMKM